MKVIKPVFEKMSEEVKTVSFVKVDVDDSADLPGDYKIKGIPAFHFFRGEKHVDEMVGASEVDLRGKVGAL